MSNIGDIERKTQTRVVALFRDKLGYKYLGNWKHQEGKTNIETELLRAWLKRRNIPDNLITRALYEFERAASNTSNNNLIDVVRHANSQDFVLSITLTLRRNVCATTQ